MAHPSGQKVVPLHGERTADQDESSLAQRLRHGDRTAAETLVERYHERIYVFMRSVGHDRQTSEDLVQETFMQVWRHIGQLREDRALTSWLFRIAANVSRLYWRRHRHAEPVCIDEVAPAQDEADGAQQAGERELFAGLHQAVGRLPWKLRQAVVLHYMDQLTIAEAAQVAQVREGTLKSRLNRALESLRKEIARQ
ncbi:MAG: RNA polymerase sigma factor [Sedimentisphaerales bacterium]|nr:RNA polymerase sigma factor [Sedimentisphaerales bacterium]NLT77402.1 RNA polymerase sigma factor [Planctomycetota bacterium]